MKQDDAILLRGALAAGCILLTFIALMAAFAMPRAQAGASRNTRAAQSLRYLYGPLPVPLIRDFQDKTGLNATGDLDDVTARELEQAVILDKRLRKVK